MKNLLNKRDKYNQKAKNIKVIAVESIKVVLEDKAIWGLAATIGLSQGLKYKGDLSAGIKAGVATIGTFAGANVIQNLIVNRELIKKS